jgi:hypothetical protein
MAVAISISLNAVLLLIMACSDLTRDPHPLSLRLTGLMEAPGGVLASLLGGAR